MYELNELPGMSLEELLTVDPDATRHLKSLLKIVVREILDDDTDKKLPPFLTRKKVCDLTGRRLLVEKEVENGNLRLSVIGGRELIRKKDYLKWRDGL
jgi:hypothetical protein